MEATITAAPPPPVMSRVHLSKAVWLVAALAFAAEMAVSARYGYVRDELYFLASGQHLAAGGVDQPELTPVLARLDALLTGNTLVGLRALPALIYAGMVLLTGSMARLLGASRRGQLVAAVATACCSVYLGAMHELTTTTPDFFCWTVALFFVTRLLTSRDPRWWVPVGAAAGAGLTAKWNIAFLLGGLLLGFACTRSARPLLRSRYLAAGAVIAAALAAPDLVWQAAHGWPNFQVFSALQQDAWANRALYWPNQVLYTSIVLAPLWIRGAAWALRSATFRPLGIAAAAVITIQFVLGGKPYYPAGVYPFLFAAGAAALFSGATASRPARGRIALYCLGAAISSVVSLAVLPASALARFPVQKIDYDLGEEIGWPSEVSLLASTWRALPASERGHATLLAGNYGEAGAAARYGPSLGLPTVYCGQNNFWLWGPPPAADTTAVVIGIDPALLRREFTQVKLVARYDNGLDVDDDEQGTPIYVATGLRGSWAQDWPAFRHYD